MARLGDHESSNGELYKSELENSELENSELESSEFENREFENRELDTGRFRLRKLSSSWIRHRVAAEPSRGKTRLSVGIKGTLRKHHA